MARNFNDILAEVDNGKLHEQLTAELALVTAAVVAQNKVGELTLTIKVKPNKENAVFFEAESKAKVPKVGVGAALFYADEEGSLTRRDPRQADLFTIKTVATASAPAKVEAPAAPLKLAEVN